MFDYFFREFHLQQSYDDQTCEKRAYVLLGEIALHEHRYDQAIELAMQGQVTDQVSKTNKTFLIVCL